MTSVAVVGSLHLDIMVEAPRLPQRDETLMGQAWHTKCGGKGGNQAVAAARFGAATHFGGRVGLDDFGRRLSANLAAAGIDISGLETDATLGSGMSVAIAESGGEYGAVVVSGANLAIDGAAIRERWSFLSSCGVLVLQNEVPQSVNIAAAKRARDAGAVVMLNAAPALSLALEMLDLVDILVVNRVEAEMMSLTSDVRQALQRLHASTRDVVLTRGGEGLLVMTRTGHVEDIAALPVQLLSSHGAGDCFCGALAARLSFGDDLVTACRFAGAAAALFVSTPEDRQAAIDTTAVRDLVNQQKAN